MEHLSNLYTKIIENHIELFTYPLAECNSDAVTVCYNSNYGIFLDYTKFESTKDEFCALAHEYGHCVTGATHTLYSPYQLISQHETKADRAATHEFLPYDVLLETIKKGYLEPWQIAEHLELPEQFVRLAIETYTREGKI